MVMSIARALAEFQLYLANNIGGKIDISLLQAFGAMTKKIMDAIQVRGE